MVEGGHPVSPGRERPDRVDGKSVIAAVLAVLHGRLAEQPMPCLAELSAPLMGMIVLPYLGAEASRGELTR